MAGTADVSAPALARSLRSFPLLSGIGEATLRLLRRDASERRYAAGESVFEKGDPSDFLLIVTSGRLAVESFADDGTPLVLNLIGPGEILGEIGVIDGGPRSATATAAVETRAALIARRDFLQVLYREPGAAHAMLRVLCSRLRQTTSFVEDAALESLPRRLLHGIQRLAALYGRPLASGTGIRIEHGLSQERLGDSIGASRVSVSRLLNAWRRAGLVGLRPGCVVVYDMQRLEERVGGRRLTIST
jgi:CRP-like cAMP-binding protein